MKAAFRNAVSFITHSRSINPNPPPVVVSLLPLISIAAVPSPSPSLLRYTRLETLRPLSSPLRCYSMAVGEAPASASLDKQFEDFRVQLEESGSLRERIRAIVMEIESSTRIMHSSLLLVHQSRPLPEVLEKAKVQIDALKGLYSRLAEVLCECTGEYYRYHGDWRSATQTVVSLLSFMHWLETGSLLMHAEAEEKLGLNSAGFALDIEDYLTGLCFLSNEMPRYVVNRVLAGDYDCPRKVLNFLTDLNAAFRMLNLRNDFLRKKFDSMKYDLKRVEEVYYDMKIRRLASEDSTENHGTEKDPAVENKLISLSTLDTYSLSVRFCVGVDRRI
ncbi:hypothetical protein LWI29_020536 [Acer saccharum]|uniref:Translin n=1 Tax=Acer saccharum TaxID=4024 RepID=A0AA39RY26_ACESA|nr:hypothetical protein LWI29_020536 [Acer saccharum]KAK1562409.1 hypothetical protein Q3G72_011371 [Acer saccharum]